MRRKIAKIGELGSRGMCVVLRTASATIFTLTIALMAVTGSSETEKVTVIKEAPKPTPWPEQFHALLVMNHTVTKEVQVIDLWYDWPNGRNLNLIQHQLGKLLYDVEWNNGTSFYYTLPSNGDVEECRTLSFEVGILRPNWLDGATYLGQRYVDGFLCNVWTKVDFIWYYEDVATKKPVYWLFYTGRNAHVMTFEVGAVLEDSQWQAPVYCFDKQKQQARQSVSAFDHLGVGLPLLRPDARAFL